MAKTPNHFPPVGDENRYDAIVSKGRSIRHRRQAVFGAGASSVLAACIALVVIFSGGNGAAEHGSIYANQGDKNDKPAKVDPTIAPEKMSLSVDREDNTFTINVNDPRMAVPTPGQPLDDVSYKSQQCILLSLEDGSGQVVAEGFGCNPFDPASQPGAQPGTAVSVALNMTDGLSVGCSSVTERIDPIQSQPQPMESTFSVDLPVGLAVGDYNMTVDAVSGFGDGCPNNPESGQPGTEQPGTEQPGDTGATNGSDNQIENMVATEKVVTIP
ncbi:MAG TPA: hypothetical protein VL068_07280 [Microthrixaceae bacterium]|nr:hypothetical protein [Microthrixaceae bacterium]